MPRVLIVSGDNDERQRAATALLLTADTQVVEVAGGVEARALLRDDAFDVLVIDGDLEPKGGFSWLYELREQAEMNDSRRPPAVVMISRVEDQFLADWASAEATVAKPVDGFEMAAAVTALTAA